MNKSEQILYKNMNLGKFYEKKYVDTKTFIKKRTEEIQRKIQRIQKIQFIN